MKTWIIIIILLLFSMLFVWKTLSSYVHGSESKRYNQISQNHASNYISRDSILKIITKEDIFDNFPFGIIAENTMLSDHQRQVEILNELEKLDSNQSAKSQEFIFISLSDTLLKNLDNSLDFNDLHTLTSLTNEVTSLFYYSKHDVKNEIFYEALFDYWMQFINQQLETVVEDNYWDKYSFEYRYISTVCQQYNYNPSTGLSNTEKILSSLVENKYAYLFNRFVLRTTTYQKIGIVLAISIIILSFSFSIYTIIKKLIK